MKTAITLVFIVLTMMVSEDVLAQQAPQWYCRNGGGKPNCLVVSVQMRNGVSQQGGIDSGSKYLIVEYLDQTDGLQKWFQLKVNNFYVTIDSLRATEALVLSSLTTGLPIAFFGYPGAAWFIAIGKPNMPILRSDLPPDY